jgi:hypothetical protein
MTVARNTTVVCQQGLGTWTRLRYHTTCTSWHWCPYLEQPHNIGQVHDVEGVIQLMLLNELAGHNLHTIWAACSTVNTVSVSICMHW